MSCKPEKAQKRRAIDEAMYFLDKARTRYEVRNHGVHLLVQGPKGRIDFWPTTGRWTDQTTGELGAGLLQLLEHMGDQAASLAAPEVQSQPTGEEEPPWS